MSDNDREWTAERIAEVRARCEAATPGPWGWTPGSGDAEYEEECACVQSGDGNMAIEAEDKEPSFFKDADAEFIANARTDLPSALREIERLRAEIADLDATEQQIAIMSRPFADMRAEEVRQEAKGRDVAHDDARTIGQWFECLSTVVERNGYRGRTARETFVKIGCVALRAIRAIDRSAGRPSGK